MDNRKNAGDIISPAEKELAEKEPTKYAARRSSLLEADKFDGNRRLSCTTITTTSNTGSVRCSSSARRRQSFLETGKFQEQREKTNYL